MKFAEFKQKIEEIYKEKFGKSFVLCSIFRCLGMNLAIDCMMAENYKECPHNIEANDMIRTSFLIHMPDRWTTEDDLPETLVMEALQNGIKTKPKEVYFYCDYRKIPYRKTTGNAEKLIAAFGKYVDRLYNVVMEEYENNNLLDYDMELVWRKYVA